MSTDLPPSPAADLDARPIGAPVPDWRPPPRPLREPMIGRYARVEPLDPDRHAADLYAANSDSPGGAIWRYLPYGPFDGPSAYRDWVAASAESGDPLFFAIVDAASNRALGVASYLRIQPGAGSIEVGHINFSPALQRSRIATEAMDLMRRKVFALGYRRYEWKCDALNAGSRRAAQRFGFSFEGVFRQAVVVKGRNRDTAWYAMIDKEAPALDEAYAAWLAPSNFTAGGAQKTALADLTGPVLVARG